MSRRAKQQAGVLGLSVAAVLIVTILLSLGPALSVHAGSGAHLGTISHAARAVGGPVNDDFRFSPVYAFGGTSVACPGDVNGSGDVTVDDLLIVLAQWGACPGCAGDVDGNGLVDVDDLLVVLATWGPCP